MKLNFTGEIDLPVVPTRLSITSGGFIITSNLTEDDLRRIAAVWTEKFVQEAAKRRGI